MRSRRVVWALVLGVWWLIPGLQAQEYTHDVWAQVYTGASIRSMAMGDVNGDGLADLVVGMPFYASYTGRVFIFLGQSTPLSSPDIILYGETADDRFGWSVAVGDVNGDGYDDVVVGAPTVDVSGNANAGAVYLFLGGTPMDNIVDLKMTGENAGDYFGYSVAVGRGLDNYAFSDTRDDIVVGAPYRDPPAGTNAGAVYVFHGANPPDGVYDVRIHGSNAYDQMGFNVDVISTAYSLYASILVGIPGYDPPSLTDAGAAFVFHGGNPMDAIVDLYLYGETSYERAGSSVANVGDLDGDGYPEFAVGSPSRDFGNPDVGAVYLISGRYPQSNVYDRRILGTQEGEQLGFTLSRAGDVNADGYEDFMIHAIGYRAPGNSYGLVRVYFGDPGLNTTPDLRLVATSPVAGGLAGGEDLNGDGRDDMVLEYGYTFRVVHNVYLYRLLAPVGGETWTVGARRTISWLGVEPADIYLSVDGGNTWEKIADDIPGKPYPETTRFTFRVPHTPTRYAMVKIADGSTGGLNPAYAAVSDSFFRINATVVLLAFEEQILPGGVQLVWQTQPGPEDLEGYILEKEIWSGTTRIRLTPSPVKDTVWLDTDRRPGTYVLSAVNGWGQTYEVGRLDVAPDPLGIRMLPDREARVFFFVPSRYDGGPTPVRLFLMDQVGRKVRLLWSGTRPEGFHVVRTSLRGIPRGVYFLRMEAGSETRSVKVSLLR